MTLHKSDKSDSGNGCYEDYIAQLDVAEQPVELRTIESNPLQTFEISLLYKFYMILPEVYLLNSPDIPLIFDTFVHCEWQGIETLLRKKHEDNFAYYSSFSL